MSTERRWPWIVLAVFATWIALYAFAYVIVGRAMYPPPLAASFLARPWGINPHALLGGIGLITGALQFSPGLRRRLRVHRIIGRVYVVAALVIATTGVYMAAYSYGGWITHAGFGLLGASLLVSTITAFVTIRRRDVESHKAWMVRSYALMFAAVALRFELPFLTLLVGMDFTTAYRIIAWFCWVPNLIVAQLIINAMRARSTVRAALPVSSPSPSPAG